MKYLFLVSTAVLFVPAIALGQEPVSNEDVFKALLDLLAAWKSGGMLAVMSAVIMFLMQLLKSPILPDAWFSLRSKAWKRFILVVLGQGAGIVAALVTGGALLPAMFAGLVSSGGALAIYHAAKDLFK